MSEFVSGWWRRRFLHRPGAAADLVMSMPTPADVGALLDRPGHEAVDLVQFVSFPVDGRPLTRSWAVGRGPARDRDPLEAVNLVAAERWFPALVPIATELARTFGAPASLQLFSAPPGAGLRPHRDLNDSFVIQIAGRKRWRVANVGGGRPQFAGNTGGELGSDAVTYDLVPGDVLYKPSHAVHATASADEPTLSLTCSITTRTAGELVLESLRRRLAADPAWLERVPLVDGPEGSDDDEARRFLEAALSRLAATVADDRPTVADLERLARP